MCSDCVRSAPATPAPTLPAARSGFPGRLSRRGVLGLGAAAAAGLTVGGSLLVTEVANAAVKPPTIIPTAEWGAKPATTRIDLSEYRPTYLVIHHMATPNNVATTKAAAYQIARDCQSWHLGNGWGDTGQHFSVSRGGYALEGRHGSLNALRGGKNFPIGIHARGGNDRSIGIETQGTFTSELPPAAQWKTLVQLAAYICQQYRIPTSRIIGHRDVNGSSTACPGNTLYAALPRFRQEVAKLLSSDPGPAPEPAPEFVWAVVGLGDRGFRTKVVQHLLRQSGRSVEVDGSFGPKTEAAVKSFQKAAQLDADGVVGKVTWPRLAVTVRNGSTGEAVKGAQVALNARGAGLQIDGSFGPATTAAARSFQQSAKLVVDAVIGPKTWNALTK
ncbi:peptidoglycan recognition protein family protein [Granulicoccus phenolivorans]|uniref:peptidoglycan recognition protein family protein n=1 Tax=Granulicoccus phenolivorans TaxID=266854 RepID=UPI0003FBE587|nr:N-acetylmuramoyl-L-alanine amidase [Granulicoccus phenolivorans]